MVEKLLFIVFGALVVGGALVTITRTNVVHGLIALVFTFINVAAVYLITQAYFLAVIQILVYAGAILVLFTFVVMFLNLREFAQLEQLHRGQRWAALIVGPLMLAEFVYVLTGIGLHSVGGGLTPAAIALAGGNVKAIGQSIFRDMLLPFEVASLILLVGMVGAIVLAKKEDSQDSRTIAIREWDVEEETRPELIEQEV
jgi:NADH-quinone oxidoreductase subunit J